MKKNRKLVEHAKQISSLDLYNFIHHSNQPMPNNYDIKIYHARELTNEYQEQIVNLFEINMKMFYEQSHDGYNANSKRNELFSDQSRYLLLLSSKYLSAFAHFRFDIDYGSRVLYLYELQVDRNCQGQGLGQWIVEQMKVLCQKTQMSKIVLTVHKANKKAIDFYMKKCHFNIDITNPDDEPVDYIILSCTV